MSSLKGFLKSGYRAAVIALWLLVLSQPLAPQEKTGEQAVDENAIFDETETVKPRESVTDDTIAKSIEKESLVLTGFLNSRTAYYMSRDWLYHENGGYGDNTLLPYFQGNLSLDARLRKAIKGFVNVSANCYPTGTDTVHRVTLYDTRLNPLQGKAVYTETDYAAYRIEEMFVDVNFNRLVYLRVGKQVLKWGTGYLWTPTDLINVELKNLLDPSQVREGAYGARLHIPFGTSANFYSFVKMNDAKNLDECSVAAKMEALVGITEFSVSALVRGERSPVYGADFSSRLFTLDIHGECAVSYGEAERRIDAAFSHAPRAYRRTGEWVPRASFGLGRGFEVLDVKDRLRIDAEVFYNGSGYHNHIFNRGEAVAGYFVQEGLYQPNYYGIYYAGLFVSFARLFVQDLSLSLYYIANISDESHAVAGIFTYDFEYNTSMTLMLAGFPGPHNREYTAHGNALAAEFMLKLLF